MASRWIWAQRSPLEKLEWRKQLGSWRWLTSNEGQICASVKSKAAEDEDWRKSCVGLQFWFKIRLLMRTARVLSIPYRWLRSGEQERLFILLARCIFGWQSWQPKRWKLERRTTQGLSSFRNWNNKISCSWPVFEKKISSNVHVSLTGLVKVIVGHSFPIRNR